MNCHLRSPSPVDLVSGLPVIRPDDEFAADPVRREPGALGLRRLAPAPWSDGFWRSPDSRVSELCRADRTYSSVAPVRSLDAVLQSVT
jgi:hypothetical protein